MSKMKINERTLIHYANSSVTPTDREGYLYKRGEVNRSFQKRWCILKGNLFYYFDKRGDREPMGVIIMEGCRIELAENEQEMFAFKLVFGGNGSRTYVLGTETQENMELWMKSLSCASYDYLKMMVSELQRQLDTMNDLQKKQLQRQSNNGQMIRSNPFDDDFADLITLKEGSTITQSNPQMSVFTRRPFAEIHEIYGLKFRKYIENQRFKHQII